ncbi:MAG: NFACT RNA binding domain-containing protein, partial [Acidobacteriota bacterium]
ARLHLHQEARSYRQALERRLRRAAKRLARLLGNLQQEASAAARHGVIRHWAEALLADLRRARRRGDQVEVRDPYGAAGESLLLTVPARVDLRHQADVWFKEARRMERAESRIHARCEEMKGRSCQLETLLDRLRKVTHVRDLEDILAALPSWVKPQQDRLRQDGEASPPGKRASLRQRRMERDPRARQVRRFRLAGGLHLLVGGNGPVNDFLTFRMARGQDFWLHAADHPGAHAILRNPSRQAYPPAAVLRQAASLAAYYSKAPRNAPVEVRWTQVKHLRKAKGSPPGTVLLPRFSTLLVRPSRPSRTGLPEDP